MLRRLRLGIESALGQGAALVDPRWVWPLAARRGDTPLMVATRVGSPAVIRLLYQLGAPPNRMNEARRDSPLRRAAAPYDWPETFTERVDVVRALLAGGEDPNAFLTHGSGGLITSPLATAAGWSLAITRELLDAGADPDRPYDGLMPLTRAVVACHVEIVRALLGAGADPDGPASYHDGRPVKDIDFWLARNERIEPESRLYDAAQAVAALVAEARG